MTESLENRAAKLLDPGMSLTLRPMASPTFYEMYRAAIKNTWTVEEVDFATLALPTRIEIAPIAGSLGKRPRGPR